MNGQKRVNGSSIEHKNSGGYSVMKEINIIT